VTLDYYWDEVQFQEEVKAHISRHATKGREEWMKDILGEGQGQGAGGNRHAPNGDEIVWDPEVDSLPSGLLIHRAQVRRSDGE